MTKPAVPANEKERLNALHEYALLDTLPEKDFDNITMLASQICNTPIAIITFIDSERQWFKSKKGLTPNETARELSFCGHAINHPHQIFTVTDSRTDDRFFDNELVTGEPHVIFYAGYPLVTESGYALGTICVIDQEPRTLNEKQQESLKALSNQVMRLLELRQKNILLGEKQAALQTTLQLFEQTSSLSKTGGWDVDFINNKITFTPVARQIHEIPEDYDLNIETGINFYKPGESRDAITEIVQHALETETSYDVELQIITAKNNERWVRTKGTSVFQNGKCVRLFGTIQDITAEKLKDIQLAQSEKLFRHTLDDAPTGIALLSPEGKWVKVNKALCNILGYTEEELYKTDYIQLTHKDDVEEEKQYVEALIKSKIQSYQIEKRYIHKKGKTVWVLRSVSLLRDFEGKPLYFIAHTVDITSRKKDEQTIKDERKLLLTLINNIPLNIFIKDLQSRKTLVNKKEIEYAGVKNEKDILGKDDFELYPYETAVISRQEDLQVFNTGEAMIDAETLSTKQDGSKHWFLTSKIPLKNEKNKITGLLGISYNIDERKNAEAALRQAEQRWKFALEGSGDGIWEFDLENGKLLFSDQYKKILGYECSHEFENNTSAWQEQIHPEDWPGIEGTSEKYKTGLINSHYYEYRIKRKDASYTWLLNRGMLMERTADGNPKKIIGTVTDINDQKILEQQLREAKREAEHSSRAKEIFIANVSHEIRTPMNAILGMSRQLIKTNINKQQQFYIDAINNATSNLLVLINDILDFSKMNAGKLQLEHIGFDLCAVINKSADVMLYKAGEKGISISVNTDKILEPVLIGDPFRINQVLLNLLSNAIKFTTKGSVQINCTVLRNTKAKQDVCIEVADTGTGMSKEFIKNLFNKFEQEDDSIGRRYGGTGLGMSIIKQLVELMDGEIEVTSEKGKGTQVKICLSFTKGNKNDLPKKPEQITNTNMFANKRILLVEDNEMNRIVAAALLKDYGAVTEEALDGSQAIEKLRNNMYDLVLMDMQLPEINGIDATKIIRQEISKTIPIIALTASSLLEEKEKCLKAGMNDFISKPFEEDEFIKTIAKRLEINIAASSERKENITAENKLFDLSKLEKLSKGDKDFTQKMLQIFVKETARFLQEVEAAAGQNDIRKINEIAHRIKPAINNMAINSITKEIVELETFNQSENNQEQLTELIHKIDAVLNEVIEQLKFYQEEHVCVS